jgi:hypothetical protein
MSIPPRSASSRANSTARVCHSPLAARPPLTVPAARWRQCPWFQYINVYISIIRTLRETFQQQNKNTQTHKHETLNPKITNPKTLHKIQNTKYLILDTAPIKHPMSSTRLTDRQTNRQNGIRTDKQTACLLIFNSVPDEPVEVSMCCGLLLFFSYCCFVCLFRLFLPSLANQPTLQCVVARRSARGAFQ